VVNKLVVKQTQTAMLWQSDIALHAVVEQLVSMALDITHPFCAQTCMVHMGRLKVFLSPAGYASLGMSLTAVHMTSARTLCGSDAETYETHWRSGVLPAIMRPAAMNRALTSTCCTSTSVVRHL
jgi:hypothetical protein